MIGFGLFAKDALDSLPVEDGTLRLTPIGFEWEVPAYRQFLFVLASVGFLSPTEFEQMRLIGNPRRALGEPTAPSPSADPDNWIPTFETDLYHHSCIRDDDLPSVAPEVRMAALVEAESQRLDPSLAPTTEALEQVISRLRESLGVHERPVIHLLLRLTDRLRSDHRTTDAQALLQAAIAEVRSTVGDLDVAYAWYTSALGQLELSLGRAEQSAVLLADAANLLLLTYGPSHYSTLATSEALALALKAAGKHSEAAKVNARLHRWRGDRRSTQASEPRS